MKLVHNVDVAKERAQAYPNVGDQLDALLALAEALKEQGFKVPEKTQQWIDSCMQVKNTIGKSTP